MSEREVKQSQLVDHIVVVNSEIVFQSCDWNVLLKLAFHHLFALVGQLLTVFHCHALDNRLLEHSEARNRLWRHRVEQMRLFW